MGNPRGGGGELMGLCQLPFLYYWVLFYKNEVYEQKISIKRVRNLSQNDGNGHFRDSNFQKFLGGLPPDPPRKCASFGARSAPLFDPLLNLLNISDAQQFFNLGISGEREGGLT